jgi:hypothetical protein
MTNPFDQWCIVELFGHNQIAGRVTEQSIGGQSFVRVDVPQTTKRDPFTKFYGGGAIYAITPVEPSVAQAMAEGLDTVPIETWRLKTIDLSRQIAASHPDRVNNDDSARWPEDEHADKVTDPQTGQLTAVTTIPDATISDRAADDVLDEAITDDADLTGRTEGWREEEAAEKAKAAAAAWAGVLLAEGDFVVFDTETTGFDEHDEIVCF